MIKIRRSQPSLDEVGRNEYICQQTNQEPRMVGP